MQTLRRLVRVALTLVAVPMLVTTVLPQAGQQEIAETAQSVDEAGYEEFPTDMKFSVAGDNMIQGMPARGPGEPMQVIMTPTKRAALQLCILSLNESRIPEKIFVRYDGITQEFLVDWNAWGWAPISLLRTYDASCWRCSCFWDSQAACWQCFFSRFSLPAGRAGLS